MLLHYNVLLPLTSGMAELYPLVRLRHTLVSHLSSSLFCASELGQCTSLLVAQASVSVQHITVQIKVWRYLFLQQLAAQTAE